MVSKRSADKVSLEQKEGADPKWIASSPLSKEQGPYPHGDSRDLK